MQAARRVVASAGLALGLLTIVRVPSRVHVGGLGAAAPWFPLVGALVGAGAAGVRLLADGPLGTSVASVLALVWLIGITGALHVDGLADCADAIGVRGGRERRLAVMRESDVGAFGVVAIVLYALLLAAAIAGLPEDDVLGTLVVAGALGRWGAIAHAAAAPPARADGLGAAFSVGAVAVLAGTVTAVALAVAVSGWEGAVAAGAAAAAVCGITFVAVRGLGGRTGDTLGTTVALTELVAVLVLLGLARP
jgi:adenosylcobinamide-GDP ribazoletransferase